MEALWDCLPEYSLYSYLLLSMQSVLSFEWLRLGTGERGGTRVSKKKYGKEERDFSSGRGVLDLAT